MNTNLKLFMRQIYIFLDYYFSFFVCLQIRIQNERILSMIKSNFILRIPSLDIYICGNFNPIINYSVQNNYPNHTVVVIYRN